MSPGGTIRQIITKPHQGSIQQRKQQQSVLQKKQQAVPKLSLENKCLENTGRFFV